MEILPAVEIHTGREDKSAVIWLHGLGANGNDFEPIIPELGFDSEAGVHFVLPHAPRRSITINGGMVMPAWFDIIKHGERHIDVAQLLASTAAVHKLIDREIANGIDSEKIVLAGFSQGGAVCLQAALTYDKPLGGLLGLSTFFPTAEAIKPHPANAGLPVQIYHGTEDALLPEWMAQNTVKYLKGMGYNPGYRTYPMGHSVCAEEIRDIADWLHGILA